jgi:putative ABC transport system ATP-binding protein
MNNPIIRVNNVAKIYEGGLVKALKGVSFDVQRSEFFVIMGPSGSGKSTLLHLLGALDTPSSGTITIDGQDIATATDLPKLRREKLGFVFQAHHLIPSLTLRENVELPALPLGLRRSERRKRATELLERVGLQHRINFLPVKASGGERQRAAIARALMNKPDILYADEPTGSVDTKTGENILSLFEEFQKDNGLTIVMITHNDEIAPRANRLVKIIDGSLVSEDKPKSQLEAAPQ